MTSGLLRRNENNVIGRLLPAVEQWLWNDESDADSQTVPVYIFKPYPASLKRAQADDWVALQCKALSPFIGGDTYSFKTAGGVAIWMTPARFQGVPETALQQALPDGTHTLQGKYLWYRQTWRNRVMVSCDAFSPEVQAAPEETQPLVIANTPWANAGKLENTLRTTSFWGGILMFIFLCMAVWFTVGYISLALQSDSFSDEATEIEATLGDKLEQQARFQQSQQMISGITAWRTTYNYLPQTLGVVMEEVLKRGDWKAELIEWQNKTLRVELNAPELDITRLVADLEASPALESVSIRPAAKNGFWILEVTKA